MKTLKCIVMALVFFFGVFIPFQEIKAQKQEKPVITTGEAKTKIFAGETLRGATIEGNLFLAGATIKEILYLQDATIEGFLDLEKTTIEGNLFLEGATIEGDLFLAGATIEGFLDLEDATIEGYLDIRGATIKGMVDLSFKKAPERIYVFEKDAQLVHWAAPTVPLVIVRDKD